jgi:hypothetical protein
MSGVQPSGTVTLVFTDVEGSTKLLEELGTDAYRQALGDHRRVVRDTFTLREGYEVDYEGDAFFYAFASAQHAVSAVSEAMVGLEAGPIRIRVGVHTGEPALDPPKYVGNGRAPGGADHERRARRAGGELALDGGAARVGDGRADRPRGPPLQGPERSRAGVPAGRGEFPPIRSLHRTNLPVPATPFLGCEEELAVVVGMLGEPDVRLVSLVGPGGTTLRFRRASDPDAAANTS